MDDLAKDDLRTVIEDARARHAAVVALIYVTDSQAMSLLRLYGTLAIATASATAAGLAPGSIVSKPLAAAAAGATAVLVLGCAFCLHAMMVGAKINLPGRGADFWLWALDPDVTRARILTAYLDNLKERGALNDRVNTRTARALRYAKFCAIAAPPVALLCGGLAFLCL
jgi:hypothetical protein